MKWFVWGVLKPVSWILPRLFGHFSQTEYIPASDSLVCRGNAAWTVRSTAATPYLPELADKAAPQTGYTRGGYFSF